MIVASAKWLRRMLLCSLYGLGVLGIVGSGGGGGSGNGLECFNAGFVPECVDDDFFQTTQPVDSSNGFNLDVNSISVAIDGSNDIYVGGQFFQYRSTYTRGIIRLNSDSSVDTGFDTGVGVSGQVDSVAQADDGSGDVYIGGDFSTYKDQVVNSIARLNLDGTLDTSFDTGTGFGFSPDDLNAGVSTIIPLKDASGDIYVGGSFNSFDGVSLGSNLIRLNSDGSLDTGFNADPGWGKREIALATDGSGDIYVIKSPEIARLNSDGSVDASFDTGPTGFNGGVGAIAIAPDGSGDVYVAGSFSQYNGQIANGIARLNSDGSLDMAFSTESGFMGSGRFITPANDGGGDIYINTNANGEVVRLNSDGTLDTGFASSRFSSDPITLAVANDGSNDVIAGGIFQRYGSRISARIIRLTSSGEVVW